MNNRIRYTLQEVQRSTFFQMPKFLFDEEFKKLSNDSRVLYTLLKDRHELSLLNNWFNEHGEVYLIYTREDMQNILNLSKPTIIKAMKDLKAHRLIDEERQGLNKPNKIYLLALNLENTRKSNFFTSKGKTNLPHNVKDLYSNNTYINNTDFNKSSQSQSEQLSLRDDTTMTGQTDYNINDLEQIKKDSSDATDQDKRFEKPTYKSDYTIVERTLKEQIEYDHFVANKYVNIEQVDEILLIMLDAILTNSPYIQMRDGKKPRELVKSVLMKVNSMDIEHTIDIFNNLSYKITDKKKYILSMLYTNKMENNSHFMNLYNQNKNMNQE